MSLEPTEAHRSDVLLMPCIMVFGGVSYPLVFLTKLLKMVLFHSYVDLAEGIDNSN